LAAAAAALIFFIMHYVVEFCVNCELYFSQLFINFIDW